MAKSKDISGMANVGRGHVTDSHTNRTLIGKQESPKDPKTNRPMVGKTDGKTASAPSPQAPMAMNETMAPTNGKQ